MSPQNPWELHSLEKYHGKNHCLKLSERSNHSKPDNPPPFLWYLLHFVHHFFNRYLYLVFPFLLPFDFDLNHFNELNLQQYHRLQVNASIIKSQVYKERNMHSVHNTRISDHLEKGAQWLMITSAVPAPPDWQWLTSQHLQLGFASEAFKKKH